MLRHFHFILFLLLLNVVPLLAMDFSWIKPSKGSGYIAMSGEVKAGDYQRFVIFMKTHVDDYRERRDIYLSSPGGNLVESLKIAGLLRQMYPTINVENATCASSCFFLYLSGAERYTRRGGSIGIHRAYFDRTYFAGLDAETARLQQARLSSLVATILEENDVPQTIREKMSSTASDDVYWLTQEEISTLGNYPAWYEELLIAKCDEFAKLRRSQDDRSSRADPFFGLEVTFLCDDKVVAPEIKKLPALLASEQKKITEASTPAAKKSSNNRKHK